MLLQTDLEHITFSKDTILTIGTFDGVHLGHQKILNNLIVEAKASGWRSVLLTFEPHPQMVIRPDRSPQIKILTTIDEKKKILEKLGLDALVVARFDQNLASKTGEEFIRDILVKTIGMSKCVIGHDHVFGKNRSGNYDLMLRLGGIYDYTVEQIQTFLCEETVVKSTLIRHLIQDGEIGKANQFLGRPYALSGIVVKGDGRGRTIGFPTANIIGDPSKLIPKKGIYACRVNYDGISYNAVTNIGSRPTFTDDSERIIEIHMLDFKDDIYNETVQADFLYRIRDEVKFHSADELKKQISEDIRVALNRGFTTY